MQQPTGLTCEHPLTHLVEDVWYCPACEQVFAGPVLVPDICPNTLALARLSYKLIQERSHGDEPV
jgi:ribosomal protein L37AE/L43A